MPGSHWSIKVAPDRKP